MDGWMAVSTKGLRNGRGAAHREKDGRKSGGRGPADEKQAKKKRKGGGLLLVA